MFKKNKEDKSIDNTYGGVRYRFSYDDSRRAAAVRMIRQSRRGKRSFRLTVGVVTVFCCTIAGLSLIYRGISKDDLANMVSGESVDGEVVAVNAHVISEESRDYPGSFSVSSMTERAREVYHMPHGVMVSRVNEQVCAENTGLIFDGDIIVAVDDVQTPDVIAFDGAFVHTGNRSVKLSVFREGKHLSFDYVIDNEK